MRSADRVLTMSEAGPVDSCLCRVRKPEDVPCAEPRFLDIAVLDMHHGYPNLGHDSLVHIVHEVTRGLRPLLESAGLGVRIISFDVRASLMIPEPPGERFQLYLGTGGPGHLDPRLNDGTADWAQGVHENPAWESGLFRLFDAILESGEAALIGICHSFGLLARWSGVARPVLRGADKGGKSSGIRENLLTDEGAGHPWFSRFAACLPDARRFRVVDSRLFDLLPVSTPLPRGIVPFSVEGLLPGNGAEDAVTGLEFARDAGGIMPRVLAVNHHPEIRDRRLQLRLLGEKIRRGEVSLQWYEERARILEEAVVDPQTELSVMRTSHFTLIAPLSFHVGRLARDRARLLGVEAGPPGEQLFFPDPSAGDRAEEQHF